MTTELLTDITIFVLALLVGFEVISKVPATLHTPLMSAANSIHGIVLAGAMLIAVTAMSMAPASTMPWIELAAYISGVCRVAGTLLITSKPTSRASTKMVMSVSSSVVTGWHLRVRHHRVGLWRGGRRSRAGSRRRRE